MSYDNNLPFQRGDSYFGVGTGDAITTDQSNFVQSMLGKQYTVFDPDYNGHKVVLRAMQYTNATPGTNLTAVRKCVDLTDETGVKFTDQAPAAGEQTYILDHKYNGLVIRDLDVVWCVEEGFCEVEKGDTAAAGANLAVAADGQLVAAAAGDNWIVGVAVDVGVADAASTVFVKGRPGIE